jgi:hypothetical protein
MSGELQYGAHLKSNSRRFDNAARFDALGAYQHFFDTTFIPCPYTLKIRIEAPFRNVMGMTHIIPHYGFFPTNFTYF